MSLLIDFVPTLLIRFDVSGTPVLLRLPDRNTLDGQAILSLSSSAHINLLNNNHCTACCLIIDLATTAGY